MEINIWIPGYMRDEAILVLNMFRWGHVERGSVRCVFSWKSFLSGGAKFSKSIFEKIRKKFKLLRNTKAEMSNGKLKPPKKPSFVASGLRILPPAPLVNHSGIRDGGDFFVRKSVANSGFKGIHKGRGEQNTKTRRHKRRFFGGFSFSIWQFSAEMFETSFFFFENTAF